MKTGCLEGWKESSNHSDQGTETHRNHHGVNGDDGRILCGGGDLNEFDQQT